ncbi:MAG: hypothetical protein P4L76_08795 [Beijerinckiaceae bacterium]|nr:hypothetical protein [Beijerinckiaceae bacterium]
MGYIGSVIDIEDRKAAEEVPREAHHDVLEGRIAAAMAERAEAEAQLRQSRKMEAVGNLTGGGAPSSGRGRSSAAGCGIRSSTPCGSRTPC